ncbi:MAG: AMP-binding enzyme, partial [Verrucomicrobiales bacterium]
MYDTGDLASWTDEGLLECLGRADHQVKVGVYRIELGEIENILKEFPSLSDAVVSVAKDGLGESQLVAYYTLQNGELPTDSTMREFLSEKLPDYMVPAFYERMDAFPLTPNQKVDRNALP